MTNLALRDLLAAEMTEQASWAPVTIPAWHPRNEGDPPPPEEKTYTKAEHEAEVNRVVQERLARDRKDRLSDDEIAELKRKAAKADELEAANLSQADKLQQAATKAEQERDEANQKAEEATARANKTLIRASVISAAAKAGAVDPDDVHALLASKDFTVTKDGNELKVTIGNDGQVIGHEEAVTAFLEGKQHLVGSTPTPGPGGGGPRPTPTRSDLSEDEKAMAKSFGITEEEYAANK
jgi:hypothetical protein